ncbi:MAG: hypothetical protein UX89_C0022G0010 [Parcubacteria group bacterium GW2011_GWA2_47_16]|nr:MAG: hypothetical protein UX89_C0022G0010 [Parcubacteria group bacterium GW2011_GWA2_47_16]
MENNVGDAKFRKKIAKILSRKGLTLKSFQVIARVIHLGYHDEKGRTFRVNKRVHVPDFYLGNFSFEAPVREFAESL